MSRRALPPALRGFVDWPVRSDPQLTEGTTHEAFDGTILDEVSFDFSSALAGLETRLGGRLAAHDPEERAYVQQARARAAEVRAALLASPESVAGIVAAFELGRLLQDWNRKDLTEPHFIRGIRNRNATSKAAKVKAGKAQRRLKAKRWAQEVDARRPGITRAAVYLKIARDARIKPETVKRAVLRYRARRRTSSK